jgi:outer membrane lipoprotein-sorting protein
MEKIKKEGRIMIKQIFMLALFLGIAQVGIVFAEAMTASQILERVEDVQWAESSRATMRQTIITARGTERSFTMVTYAIGGNEKQLIRYTEPARVKGSSFLMLNEGDDIWFHTPETGRTRKLASHMKRRRMMGSDFSYEDMAGSRWIRDFEATLLGTETERNRICYNLKLVPTPEGPAYSKMLLWIDKENFIPLRVDYYDEGGRILKRLTMDRIEEIGGRITPMKFTMENLQEGGKTIIEITEIEFDIPISKEMFTPGGMGR